MIITLAEKVYIGVSRAAAGTVLAKNGETLMTTNESALPAKSGRIGRIALWTLQGLGTAAFIAAGSAKLAGVPAMVEVFDQVGVGQWFRYVTGGIEVIGGLALLHPRTAAFGALLLATTMVFAVLTHLFVIGGSPVPALVLFAVTAAVAWFRRASFGSALARA